MDYETFTVRIPSDLAAELAALAPRLAHPDVPPPSRNAVIVAVLRAGLSSYGGPVAPVKESSDA